jgi:YgiT-type zinc finger domain-containing protein
MCCPDCRAGQFKSGEVEHATYGDGHVILFTGVPGLICVSCEEEYFAEHVFTIMQRYTERFLKSSYRNKARIVGYLAAVRWFNSKDNPNKSLKQEPKLIPLVMGGDS